MFLVSHLKNRQFSGGDFLPFFKVSDSPAKYRQRRSHAENLAYEGIVIFFQIESGRGSLLRCKPEKCIFEICFKKS